jgi:hypothetical protein
MSRWPGWFAAASLAFACWTGLGYAGQALREGLAVTALFAFIILTVAGAGRALLGIFRLHDAGEPERVLIGATLGLGLLSLGVFVLGALGVLTPLAAALLLGLFWLAGFSSLRGMAGLLRGGLPAPIDYPAACAGILVVLCLLFWTTWVPPHQYDSLVYHLALPEAYIRAGRLLAVDHLLFSHFPQNGEMLFTLALLLKRDLLAQMLVWSCSALAVGWVLLAGRREAPLPAVLLGCWLLVTHTAVMLLSGTTYVEPIVMLWVTAAVFSFSHWHGMAEKQPGRRGWLLLSAVFCGLALGAKYYAGITAGLLGFFLLLRFAAAGRSRRKARAVELGLFCGATIAVFSPWLVKNIIMVGNPVFPFLYRYFPNTGTGWQGTAARDYFNVLTEYGHGGRFLEALAKLPFLLLGNSQRFGGGMDVLGNFGWELSFWCLPLAVWAARGSRFLRGLLIFFFCYMAVWFSTGVVLRFLTVTAPVLCLLAGVGLHALWGRLGKPGRLGLGLAVGLLSAVHLLLFGFVHGVFGSGDVLLGLEDRETFLSRRLDYYPCARWSAESLGKNDKILLVGEQRGYYVGQDHLAATANAPNRFLAWAAQEPSPAAFAGRLRAEGFTHVLLVPREAQRLAPAMRPFSETAQANLAGLDLESIFQGPSCRVYSLERAGGL